MQSNFNLQDWHYLYCFLSIFINLINRDDLNLFGLIHHPKQPHIVKSRLTLTIEVETGKKTTSRRHQISECVEHLLLFHKYVMLTILFEINEHFLSLTPYAFSAVYIFYFAYTRLFNYCIDNEITMMLDPVFYITSHRVIFVFKAVHLFWKSIWHLPHVAIVSSRSLMQSLDPSISFH